MNGVAVLYTQEIAGCPIWIPVIIRIFVVFLLGLCGLHIYITLRDKGKYSKADFKELTKFIVAIICCLFLAFFCEKIKPHTYYKVTIDQDVPYVEFTRNYKEISREGNIYLVERIH